MGMLFSKDQSKPLKVFQVSSSSSHLDLDSIQPVLKSLEDHTQSITKVSIKGFSYSEEALSLLSNTIQECQKVETADFSEISPSMSHLETLNSTLLCLHNLYEVDLSKNFLTESSIDVFSFLFHSDCLKVLRLDDNLLGVEGAMKLAEALRNSELKLQVFSAERNALEDQGVLELSEAIFSMGSLRQVSLSGNRLGKEGIILLCRSLTGNCELQVVEIADSYCNEDIAFVSIRQLLEKTNFLSRVNFNDCFLGNAGSREVLTALLNSNQNLAELLLAYNEIDDDDVADLLCEVIKCKRLLEVHCK
jgi:Ran GTPase-activating protein (RanGAP) involved in mRNA processing and transport